VCLAQARVLLSVELPEFTVRPRAKEQRLSPHYSSSPNLLLRKPLRLDDAQEGDQRMIIAAAGTKNAVVAETAA
jgi:hypothetical protein